MASYFLAADGSDEGPGDEPTAPWRTLDRLNAGLAAGSVRRGDVVRLRRGDRFRGRLASIPATEDRSGPWLLVGAYGSGQKPIVSGYLEVPMAAWRQGSANSWAVGLAAVGAAPDADIGFLEVAGTVRGGKRASRDDLAHEWDFCTEGGELLVRTSSRPVGPVLAALRGDLVVAQTRLALVGITLEGGGSHGVAGGAYEAPSMVQIIDCSIRRCGGSYLPGYGDGTTRYGNGVEAWLGCDDWVVEGNEISECYDAAVTFQGDQSQGRSGSRRLSAQRNRIWDNCQSFELWTSGSDTSPGSGFQDCRFSDNVCLGAGRGWSLPVRPDPEGRGTHVLGYQQELPLDLVLTNNLFHGAVSCHSFFLEGRLPQGFRSDDNLIGVSTATPLMAQRRETLRQQGQFSAATGMDGGSIWFETGVAGPSRPLEVLAAIRSSHPELRQRLNAIPAAV